MRTYTDLQLLLDKYLKTNMLPVDRNQLTFKGILLVQLIGEQIDQAYDCLLRLTYVESDYDKLRHRR